MTTFYDDFERANGALGGNWAVTYDTPAISGGYVQATGAASAYNTTISSNGRHEVTCKVALTTAYVSRTGPWVKSTGTNLSGYSAKLYGTVGTPTLAIFVGGATVSAPIASVYIDHMPPSVVTIKLIWDEGHLTASLDDTYTCEVDDADWADGIYGGIACYSTYGKIADCRITLDAAETFTVAPVPIGNYGACVELQLSGTGTDWTPGTPGAPIFTVDHGTISAQTVLTESTATITYCPGDYLGAVTFTDPSTGRTFTTIVTSDPGIVPPTGSECLLDEDGAALVNVTADHTSGDLTTSDMIVGLGIGGAPNLTLIQAIADLWYAEFRTAIDPPSGYQGSDVLSKLWLIINGGWDPPIGPWPEPGASTLKQDAEAAVTHLSQLRTGFNYTLDDVLSLLGGFPLLSHQDLKTAIDNISGGSNQDVLDMLLAMWGTSTPTLTQIATLISDLSTIAGYTLGDVLDAVAAQDVHGHTEQVLAAIAALRGDNIATVAGSHQLLSDMNDALQEVKTSLQEIRAPFAYTFQDILDAIAAIPWRSGEGTAGAPVWPGIAGVTIGPAWPLSTGLTVTAPMDGVVVEIVAVAPKLNGHLYTYHDIACYRNVGALAFVSDRGDVETYQALGFTKAIYTPRYLKRAAAVKVMCPAGTAGSVRAWTVNP